MNRNDFAPRLVQKKTAAVAAPPAVVAPQPVEIGPTVAEIMRHLHKQQAPTHGWEFVPVRDSDNLIVKIIARPFPL